MSFVSFVSLVAVVAVVALGILIAHLYEESGRSEAISQEKLSLQVLLLPP
jgi:hypothetical protein